MYLNYGAEEKTLRTLSTARRTKYSIINEVKPDYALETLIIKLSINYFGQIMQRQVPLEKTLMPGKIEGQWKTRR